MGSLRLRFRWSRGSVSSSCSENATANWNHVVRIKSRSPSFLSLIRAHCLSALKEAVKYLTINEPHLPTYLLSWDSPLSSRTLLALQALCFLSWAPAWPLAAQEMAGHSFVLLATLDSPCLEGNQVSPSLKEPQALHLSRYHLYPEVSDSLPCGHPWASTAPHGPECLVAIHALEPV